MASNLVLIIPLRGRHRLHCTATPPVVVHIGLGIVQARAVCVLRRLRDVLKETFRAFVCVQLPHVFQE